MKKSSVLFLAAASAIVLTGCDKTKETLGFTKSSPDEFMVMSRAPLEMPPDYALRPPVPGAERPQEQAIHEGLRETVLGESQRTSEGLSSGENFLLQQTGGVAASSDIRSVVDYETAKTAPKSNKSVAEKLVGFGKKKEPETSIVDPVKESERLRQNRENDLPVTEGETPARTE